MTSKSFTDEVLVVAWQTFNPAQHALYQDVRCCLDSQYSSDDFASNPLAGIKINWNYERLPVGLTTFNIGEQSICHPHVDDRDFLFGWAPTKCFGAFNPKEGGHIVFWDLGIAFEFPPGTEIFFPSALLIHFNTSLQPGETRYSVTSYSSGGEFEWVYRGGLPSAAWNQYLDKHPQRRRLERLNDSNRIAKLWDVCFPIWQ